MEAELDSAPDSDKELEAIFQGVTSTEPALNIPARSVAAALEAVWELDALLELLLSQVVSGVGYDTPSAMQNAMRTRGLAIRMRDLTSVLMSVVGDDSEDAGHLEKLLYGRRLDDLPPHRAIGTASADCREIHRG